MPEHRPIAPITIIIIAITTVVIIIRRLAPSRQLEGALALEGA